MIPLPSVERKDAFCDTSMSIIAQHKCVTIQYWYLLSYSAGSNVIPPLNLLAEKGIWRASGIMRSGSSLLPPVLE